MKPKNISSSVFNLCDLQYLVCTLPSRARDGPVADPVVSVAMFSVEQLVKFEVGGGGVFISFFFWWAVSVEPPKCYVFSLSDYLLHPPFLLFSPILHPPYFSFPSAFLWKKSFISFLKNNEKTTIYIHVKTKQISAVVNETKLQIIASNGPVARCEDLRNNDWCYWQTRKERWHY